MKRTRLSAFLLALCLTLTLSVPAGAADDSDGWLVPKTRTYTEQFTDVTADTWCADAVETVYEAGLMGGVSDHVFDTSGSLTMAQITVIAARLHQLLHGGDGSLPAPVAGEAWYQSAAEYLNVAVPGWNWTVIAARGGLCDRAGFVEVLSAVLPDAALPAINHISTVPDVNPENPSDEAIYQMYNAGILTGSNAYGSFRRYDTLTRGQAAAMLARVVDPAQRVAFTPQVFCASEAYLGLSPQTPVLTIGTQSVDADLYTWALLYAMLLADQEQLSNTGDLSARTYYSDYPLQETAETVLACMAGLLENQPVSAAGGDADYGQFGLSDATARTVGAAADAYDALAASMGISLHTFDAEAQALNDAVLQRSASMARTPAAAYKTLDISAAVRAIQSIGSFYL